MPTHFPIVQICCLGRPRVQLPLECYRTHVYPNEHPNHVSYGHILMKMWREVMNEYGMLWLEGDVAIAPEHLQELSDEQKCYPDLVITVPYLLYPKSTGRQRPMWSSQGRSPLGASVPYDDTAIPPPEPGFFSLGCTYLPKALLEHVKLDRGNWDYPCLDTRLSDLAYDHGIRCRSTDTPALHLNY